MIGLHFQPGITQPDRHFVQKKQNQGFLSRPDKGDQLSFSSQFVNSQVSKKYETLGNEQYKNNNFDKAAIYYQKSIKIKPDNEKPYYRLAKIYKKNGDLNKSIRTYQELLRIKPNEIEAQTLIGYCLMEIGDYDSAKMSYQKAVEIDPNYDFAKRSLKKVENLMLAEKDPQAADRLKKQAAKNNLKKSIDFVKQHASPALTRSLREIEITFDETDSLSGHKNIAQYENHNKRIVITSDYVWAAPEVTAAYIIHEAVHARDRDGLTSVREEQDAYQASIEFWIAHNNGQKDPELDYAAGLYKDNPETLRKKVGQTYRSRDASIPDYSPNHIPPEKQGFFSKLKMFFYSLRDNYTNSTMPIN